MPLNKVYLISVILLCSITISAQSRKELEKQRMDIIKEIEKTSKVLDNTRKNKAQGIAQLKALEEQMTTRKKLINTLKNEVDANDKAIQKNLVSLDSLHQREQTLNEQYAGILRAGYLRKMSNSRWSYLLSAQNLNNLFLRWKYLSQFDSFSKQKAEEINLLTQQITDKNQAIEKSKTERLQIMVQTEENVSKLTKEQQEKDKLVKKLSAEEQKLQTSLVKREKERENLNTAIEKVILAELAKAKDAEKTKPESKKKTEINNSDFAKNKGSLPWPVSKGTITGKFGTHPHPTIKSLEISNNGIDITLPGNDDVKCVFDGEVVGVTNIPGYKNMIIIRHGNYYTVYSKVDEATVSKGQKLKRGQTIGKLTAESNGKSELHFELWKNKTKLNPASWIGK